MAKSQETFSKKEKEKKRRKKRQEKLERRQQRKLEKAEAGKKSFEDMIMYVDEFGNFTSTPPDPSKRTKIKAENIQLGVPSREHEPMEIIRRGVVKFFNHEKGYGFITDSKTKESLFVHINNINGEVTENDKVIFEVEMGQKGPNAVRVSIAPPEVKLPPKKEEPKTEGDAKDADAKNADATPEAESTETEAKAVKADDAEIKDNTNT